MRKFKIIPALPQSQIDLFNSKIDIRGEDECWKWKGYLKDENSYGQFCVFGRDPFSSHRLALFIATGFQYEVARHTCDYPPCCNPKHLVWGTTQDNMKDMNAKSRHGNNSDKIQGARNGMAKLKETDVLSIRDLAARKLKTQAALADMYNVTVGTVQDIIYRISWKNI